VKVTRLPVGIQLSSRKCHREGRSVADSVGMPVATVDTVSGKHWEVSQDLGNES
jgi:hypothetical protein